MKTPEEIKKGLECCNTYNDCRSCPYDDKVEKGWGCCVQRNADVLAYIQLLEAKVAEYEKLLAEKASKLFEYDEIPDGGVAWLECANGDVKMHEAFRGSIGYIFYYIGSANEFWLPRDGYGKNWRCWNSKPTDEEKKAAKWDD